VVTGYDGEGNSRGDLSTSSVLTTDDSAATVNGSTITFRTAGSHTVTATSAGKTATATVTVNAGALSYLTVSPSTANVTAGGSKTFTVDGFDALGNSVGDETSNATLSSNIVGDNVTVNSVRFSEAGTHVITAKVGTTTATATVMVAAGPLASITVSPTTSTVTAGGSKTFTVEGFDGEGNDLGDVTGDTVVTSDAESDTVQDATVTFESAGTHAITATDGAAVATATVTVNPATLDHLVVTPATATATVSDSKTFTVEGFDVFDNSLGDVTTDTLFTTDVTSDHVDGATITFTRAGSHTVIATDGAATATAVVQVDAGPLDSITVSPQTANLTAGDSQEFTAEGFDAQGNSLGDVTADSTFASGVPTDGVNHASITFVAAGAHTITATDGRASATATVTVAAGPVASLTLTPADSTVTAGASVTFAVEGFDAEGNSVGDEAAVLTSDDSTDVVAGSQVAFGSAGTHTITATVGPRTATATVLVQVDPASIGSITLTLSEITAKVKHSVTAMVTAKDDFGNDLGDVTSQVALTSNYAADVIDGSTITFGDGDSGRRADRHGAAIHRRQRGADPRDRARHPDPRPHPVPRRSPPPPGLTVRLRGHDDQRSRSLRPFGAGVLAVLT
jgi:hypothetical protein